MLKPEPSTSGLGAEPRNGIREDQIEERARDREQQMDGPGLGGMVRAMHSADNRPHPQDQLDDHDDGKCDVESLLLFGGELLLLVIPVISRRGLCGG